MGITEMVEKGKVFLKDSQFSFLAKKESYRRKGKTLKVKYILGGGREFYGRLFNAGISKEEIEKKIRDNFEALDNLLTDFGERKKIEVKEGFEGLKRRIVIAVDDVKKYEIYGSLKRGILDYFKEAVSEGAK